MKFVSNRPERSAPGATFTTEQGPLRIERSRPLSDRWVVAFEGVTTRPGAERLTGAVLMAPALVDSEALWVHDLVGSQVVDAGDGRPIGMVAAVLANPASDILELEDGGLVPARFIVDRQAGRLYVVIPPGLLD